MEMIWRWRARTRGKRSRVNPRKGRREGNLVTGHTHDPYRTIGSRQLGQRGADRASKAPHSASPLGSWWRRVWKVVQTVRVFHGRHVLYRVRSVRVVLT